MNSSNYCGRFFSQYRMSVLMIKDHRGIISLPRKKLEHCDLETSFQIIRGKGKKNILYWTEEIARLRTFSVADFILIKVTTYNKGITSYPSVPNNIASEYIVLLFTGLYIIVLYWRYLFNVFWILLLFSNAATMTFAGKPLPLPWTSATSSHWCSEIHYYPLSSSF